MEILLYGNGASGNHGCEAIVRGTTGLLGTENNSYIVLSDCREQDESGRIGRNPKCEDRARKNGERIFSFRGYADVFESHFGHNDRIR